MKSLDNKKSEKAEAKAGEPGGACFTCPYQEACKAAQEAGNEAPAEEKIDFSNVVIEPLFSDTVDFETFSKSDFRAVKVLECEAVPKSKKLLKFTLDDGTGTNRTILSGIHAFTSPNSLSATGLVRQEKKLLMIDADPQASLSICLGIPRPDNMNLTLTDPMVAVVDETYLPRGSGIVHHKEGADFLPANIGLSGMETFLVNTMSREHVLKEGISELRKDYDYMLDRE